MQICNQLKSMINSQAINTSSFNNVICIQFNAWIKHLGRSMPQFAFKLYDQFKKRNGMKQTSISLKLTWSAERATAPQRHISGYTGKRNLSSLWGWMKKIINQIYIGAKVSQYGWPKFWTVRHRKISTFHHIRMKQHIWFQCSLDHKQEYALGHP